MDEAILKYFEQSQKVKVEILESGLMKQGLRKLLVPWEVRRGNTNEFYPVTQLESGLYVGFRKMNQFSVSVLNFNDPRNVYEYYCTAAAKLCAAGMRAPSFSVGVRKGPVASGLFVEDFTQGGEYRIKSRPASDSGIVVETGEEVYFDIDYFSSRRWQKIENILFMDEKNTINL
jgi:hypothetical protein